MSNEAVGIARVRAIVFDGVVLLVVWLVVGWVVEWGFDASPAREGYAAIAAWWAALYLSRLRGIPFFHSICIFAVLLTSCVLLGYRWLEAFGWHDMPTGGLHSIAECLWYAAVLISPPVVDACVNATMRGIRGRTHQAFR
jgi:hypothetical protein